MAALGLAACSTRVSPGRVEVLTMPGLEILVGDRDRRWPSGQASSAER